VLAAASLAAAASAAPSTGTLKVLVVPVTLGWERSQDTGSAWRLHAATSTVGLPATTEDP
jgi:hypothetical protein